VSFDERLCGFEPVSFREIKHMEKEPDFRDSFMLGIAVARSMGFKESLGKIFEELGAIARGDVMLGGRRKRRSRKWSRSLGVLQRQRR
jgi:hypothetical protein